jgi:hypothetical protein
MPSSPRETRIIRVPDRWCLHAYYTLCPYAPDGSGRLLVAGADLETMRASVFVITPAGDVAASVGDVPVTPSFWHTGLWQSWSPDGRHVYYQAGTLQRPATRRHELASGVEVELEGDMEGSCPAGEPGLSCWHGMLYAAGYGDGIYKPQDSPVPFQARDRHGLSRVHFDQRSVRLLLSTEQILASHPQRDRLLEADREVRRRLGRDEGLTLMTYCVRWNRQGTRCLFYFGNHSVAKERGEPKLAYVFTATRDLADVRLALDLSFDRRGVHWGWQPDGETLIGYGPHPRDPTRRCLAEVRFDGQGYRMLSEHDSGGHPSASPLDPDLLLTDELSGGGGSVVFLSRRTGEEVERVDLAKFIGPSEPPGRNPLRVCHHPVFNRRGDRVLSNALPGRHAHLVEFSPPGAR